MNGRLISFMHTADAIRARRKIVTRRVGWKFIKPGTPLTAVVQNQGLPRGASPEVLAALEVVDVRREPLAAITDADVLLEGYHDPRGVFTRHEFIRHFCATIGGTSSQLITRIAFRYVDPGPPPLIDVLPFDCACRECRRICVDDSARSAAERGWQSIDYFYQRLPGQPYYLGRCPKCIARHQAGEFAA